MKSLKMLAVLLLTVILSSCQQELIEEGEEFTGIIVEFREKGILVVEYPPVVNKEPNANIISTKGVEIVDESGKSLSKEKLDVGMKIKTMIHDVHKSYPGQARVTKIEVLPHEYAYDLLSVEQAIKNVLLHFSDHPNWPLYVRDIEASDDVYMIVLDGLFGNEPLITVSVDIANGNVIE